MSPRSFRMRSLILMSDTLTFTYAKISSIQTISNQKNGTMSFFEYKVRFHQRGMKLLDFLEEQFTYFDREGWESEILKKNLFINEQPAQGEEILKMGDVVKFSLENYVEPEVNTNYEIIYEDEFLLGVNKPANLPIHPSGRYKRNTLHAILEEKLKMKLFIIHRIDRETSGVVIFSKSKIHTHLFQKLFSNEKIQKEYIAYVKGMFPNFLTAKGFIGRDSNSKIRKKQKFDFSPFENSKECFTTFSLIEKSRELSISKISCIPKTGRMHQIRATLFSMGFPILGDKIYGENEEEFLEFIQTGKVRSNFISRQALHSHKLTFKHPILKREIELQADEPNDLKKCLLFKI